MRRIIVLLIVSVILISCESKKKRIYREKRERFKEDCKELITKYNPIELADDFHYRDLVLTVELEKKIISNNENLIYVTVILNDIVSKDSIYSVKFDSDWRMEPEIYFTLDCERKLGDKLLAANLDNWDDIAMIASIVSIQKIRFDFDCVVDDEYGYIEIYPSDVFFAKGKLIDFVYEE